MCICVVLLFIVMTLTSAFSFGEESIFLDKNNIFMVYFLFVCKILLINF